MSRRHTLLLFHALDCLFDISVLLNAKLLEVAIKLLDPSNKLLGGLVKLPLELVLVSLDFTVLEVLDSCDGIGPRLLVLLPVLLAFLQPLVHEVLVLLHFRELLLSGFSPHAVNKELLITLPLLSCLL